MFTLKNDESTIKWFKLVNKVSNDKYAIIKCI